MDLWKDARYAVSVEVVRKVGAMIKLNFCAQPPLDGAENGNHLRIHQECRSEGDRKDEGACAVVA